MANFSLPNMATIVVICLAYNIVQGEWQFARYLSLFETVLYEFACEYQGRDAHNKPMHMTTTMTCIDACTWPNSAFLVFLYKRTDGLGSRHWGALLKIRTVSRASRKSLKLLATRFPSRYYRQRFLLMILTCSYDIHGDTLSILGI